MKVIISEAQFKNLIERHYEEPYFGDDEESYDDEFGKFDPDYFEDSDEGFSSKMHQKILDKKIKRNSLGIGDDHYFRKKEVVVPRDEHGKEIKWSPIKKDEMSLSDYIKYRNGEL